VSAPLPARYVASPGASPLPVVLTVADRIVFLSGGVTRSAPIETTRVSSGHGGPGILTFSDGAWCEANDRPAFDRLLGVRAPQTARQWEGAPWRLGLVLAAIVLMLAAASRYAIPALAGRVARAIPADVSRAISDETLALLERDTLEPSQLPDHRQRQIAAAFDRLLRPEGEDTYRLEFRKSDAIGANAMALPSGTIVVTDALVMLARHDEELLGVLAHEAGHIDHRHGLRLAVQSSALAATAGWIAGDLGSMMAVAPTALINAKYSRDFEREADAYAARLLRAQGIRPAVLAGMLERLDNYERERTGVATGTRVLDYLATHPATDERLAFLRDF
jgi:Zn-dependent protease with chaperone function